MDMIVHEDPGMNCAFGVLNVLTKTFKEPVFILAVAEDIRSVDSSDHDVV